MIDDGACRSRYCRTQISACLHRLLLTTVDALYLFSGYPFSGRSIDRPLRSLTSHEATAVPVPTTQNGTCGFSADHVEEPTADSQPGEFTR
jgi:hypothetical protein